MLGIILCGGQSLRMGADKGLLVHQDKLWAQIAAGKLCSLGLPVKISVNAAQLPAYTGNFGAGQIILDQPSLDIKGPLLGLLSAHLSAPKEDLFLLACDLLTMENRLLEKLLGAFRSSDSFDAYIFTKIDQKEPMCGIYRPHGLQKILLMCQTPGMKKHSMKFVLGNLQVCEIALDENDYFSFRNFNSPSDISNL